MWRIRIFLLLVNLTWMVTCWVWIDRSAWLWIIPIALSVNFLLLTYDQVLNFRAIKGHPLVGNDPWGLLKIIHELSKEIGVPRPLIFLVDSPSAQIFAYAKTRSRTRLMISEGALELLTPRQLQAVLTYQMLAARDGYTVLNYWCAAVLDLFFRGGQAVERAFGFVFGWKPPLAAALISPWMWLMRVTILGARDFVRLDRETAAVIDNPEDLAQALWSLESYAQTKPWPEPWIFAHMCIVSPLSRGRLMRVQPALPDRIRALIGRYPL